MVQPTHLDSVRIVLTVGVDPEADRQLERLGVPSELILEAIRVSEFARDNCRLFHPPGYPGTVAWGEATCKLAELLTPRGWEQINDGGLILLQNPEKTDCINVQQGDEWTGHRVRSPRLRYPRDGHLAEVMEVSAQLPLPMAGVAPQAPKIRVPVGMRIWVLLRFRAEASERVQCELSLPDEIEENGDVGDWGVRLLFKDIDLDGGPSPMSGFGPTPDADDVIDIPIARK